MHAQNFNLVITFIIKMKNTEDDAKPGILVPEWLSKKYRHHFDTIFTL